MTNYLRIFVLQYQSKSYYIIGQEVYYSIGRFYYIIGHVLQYRAFITLSVGTGLQETDSAARVIPQREWRILDELAASKMVTLGTGLNDFFYSNKDKESLSGLIKGHQ